MAEVRLKLRSADGRYSHPAQGIKQIINGLIQIGIPH